MIQPIIQLVHMYEDLRQTAGDRCLSVGLLFFQYFDTVGWVF